MNRILSLLLCIALPLPVSVSRAAPAAGKAAAVPARPGELLTIWKDYGLPLPPPDAPLVRFSTGMRMLSLEEPRPVWGFGFLIHAADAKSPARILSGFMEVVQERGTAEVVERIEPVASSLGNDPVAAGLELFGPEATLGAAVQCEARGWTEFSRLLLEKIPAEGSAHPYSMEALPLGASVQDRLYALIWQYLKRQAMTPGADRAPVAAKMKRLLDGGHDLGRTGSGAWLHTATQAAAQPGRGAPGSPEALLDRLIDSRKGGGAAHVEMEPDLKDPYYAVEALGFAAVPALLEHLDDPRLTCAMTEGFNNFPPWPRRVRDLVGDLLQGLAGADLGKSWLDRQNGSVPAAATVRAWWEKARKTGEEAWMVRGALPQKDTDSSFPNPCHLRVLQARYPKRLPDVLRAQMQKFPRAQIHPVLAAIAGSTLPKEEQTVLFHEAAMHQNPETRLHGLAHLAPLDPALFQAEVIRSLNAMKPESAKSYWTSPEASLAHLALLTDDEAVWSALFRAAQRASTGLRMEMMNPLDYNYVGENYRPQRLKFLAAFLDDTALRVMPDDEKQRTRAKLDGPCAAFAIPRLRVCDFAAMKIASILHWQDRPGEKWTQEQWEALRTRVKQAPEITGK